VDAEQ
jgi:hypothetical protein